MENSYKTFLLLVITAMGVVSCKMSAEDKQEKEEETVQNNNPIFPGWYADPEGNVFDDKYWIFLTYSASYDKQVYLHAFSLKDLVNWEKQERIIDTAEVKRAKWAMSAPAIIKKDEDDFLFFGANDIQSDDELGGIGVAKASHPEGPYTDHLGKYLICKFYNGAQPIDQFVFEDEGEYYIFYGGWEHWNVAKLNDDFTGFETFEYGETFKEVTTENYVEGPLMFKRDGRYNSMWSEGGWTGPDYSVTYAIADSPTGPFKRIGTILQQEPEIANGAGRHSVLKNPVKDDYYVHIIGVQEGKSHVTPG